MTTAASITASAPDSAQAAEALVEAVLRLQDGAGSASDFQVLVADIVSHAGYFDNPSIDASPNAVQRWLGRREICARILFLAGVQGSALDELRHAADAERRLRVEANSEE